MAVDLLSLTDTLPAPDGLSIQRVQDDGTLSEWSVALGLGFEAPNSLMDYFVDAWSNFMRQVDPDTTQAYLARLNGQPVATSIMQFGAGVAGIYAVSTIPSARRQGIGARVTLEQQITSDVRFTYITNLASAQQQIIQVEWIINRRWFRQSLNFHLSALS